MANAIELSLSERVTDQIDKTLIRVCDDLANEEKTSRRSELAGIMDRLVSLRRDYVKQLGPELPK